MKLDEHPTVKRVQARTAQASEQSSKPLDVDWLRQIVMDAGAEDVKVSDETYDVYAPIYCFEPLRNALEANGLTLTAANLEYIGTQMVELSGSEASAALKLLDVLEDYDDILNVYSNLDISDEELARMEG